MVKVEKDADEDMADTSNEETGTPPSKNREVNPSSHRKAIPNDHKSPTLHVHTLCPVILSLILPADQLVLARAEEIAAHLRKEGDVSTDSLK